MAGPVLACQFCGHEEPFLRLPLFVLTGPSGAGKSTVGRLLARRLSARLVVLDQDLLWIDALRDPDDDYGTFRRTWLRLIATLNQNARPTLLCGTVVPPQFENRPERVLLGDIHYLALTCDDDPLRERLRTRPAWRDWDEPRIAEMIDFNHWVRANTTTPPMTLLDTTHATPMETAEAIERYVQLHLDAVTLEP
jgi:broad-specificity NMP kinase